MTHEKGLKEHLHVTSHVQLVQVVVYNLDLADAVLEYCTCMLAYLCMKLLLKQFTDAE